MIPEKTVCASDAFVEPPASTGMVQEPCDCWMGESPRMLPCVAHRLAVRVLGRKPLRQMLDEYVSRIYRIGPEGDALLSRGMCEHAPSRDRDLLAFELSAALRDVAETLASDVACTFVRSAKDIYALAEEGEADDALASWIARSRQAGVTDTDFLKLGNEP